MSKDTFKTILYYLCVKLYDSIFYHDEKKIGILESYPNVPYTYLLYCKSNIPIYDDDVALILDVTTKIHVTGHFQLPPASKIILVSTIN